MKQRLHKLGSDPRVNGTVYADAEYPGTHVGLTDIDFLVGPTKILGGWGLGNLASRSCSINRHVCARRANFWSPPRRPRACLRCA